MNRFIPLQLWGKIVFKQVLKRGKTFFLRWFWQVFQITSFLLWQNIQWSSIIEIQLTCQKCMKVLFKLSIKSILNAFTWHRLYLVMRSSSEMLREPFSVLRALNEWLLMICWWNKRDLNPWTPNTLVVAVSGLMMVGVGLLVIRFNWGWDQLFEVTSWRPSSDGPGVGRGCQGIMIRIQ